MTPEELRKLDEEMALGMGWKLVQSTDPRRKLWKKPNGDLIEAFFWHPTTDHNQAFEVVDYISDTYHKYIKILGLPDLNKDQSAIIGKNYYAQYIVLSPAKTIDARNKSLPLAICLAAREVFRVLEKNA